MPAPYHGPPAPIGAGNPNLRERPKTALYGAGVACGYDFNQPGAADALARSPATIVANLPTIGAWSLTFTLGCAQADEAETGG